MDVRTLGIVLVIVALLGSVAGRLVRGRAVSKAQDQFMAGDFEGMIKTLDGAAAKTGLPPFNLHYMRLNGFEAMQDVEGEKAELNVLLRMRCTDVQRRLVLARAMNFYEMQKDREGAEHVLELMESFEDKDLLRDARHRVQEQLRVHRRDGAPACGCGARREGEAQLLPVSPVREQGR